VLEKGEKTMKSKSSKEVQNFDSRTLEYLRMLSIEQGKGITYKQLNEAAGLLNISPTSLCNIIQDAAKFEELKHLKKTIKDLLKSP
jgi:hypothetical protein